MSEPLRIAVVGATGLVGREIIGAGVGREDIRLAAIARREAKLPAGARMELFVADADKWPEVLEAVRPRVVISALGTTWAKAGKDESRFRAVDHDLVLATARASKAAGADHFVCVSSVGADSHARAFYLRVKGETDAALARIGFDRLDILRPGLLRGDRGPDRRLGERAAILASPLVNMLLHGSFRKMRAIEAALVAHGALALAKRNARGRFVHDNDGIVRAARELSRPALKTQ